MALPINTTPIYTLVIPSTQKQFKYRPFLVRDQKALLAAQQSESAEVMLDTVKEVIQACAKTEINVADLASFDIEYIFSQMRAMSVGEIVDLIFRCDDCEDEKAQAVVAVDLTKLQVVKQDNHTNQILLFGTCGVKMKYPTIETLKKLEHSTSEEIDQVFNVICDCIEYIYTDEEMFPAHEQPREDMVEFLNNLTDEQFTRIQEFFNTMPVLRVDIEYQCPVCNKHHNKYLEGLQSFF